METQSNKSYGFIIIRHVNSNETNQYWIECCQCIRKFYDIPILIIDDNSKKDFLTDSQNTFKDCTIIYDQENPGNGEILPYYYFLKLKPFDNAIILHDSVFIKEYIDFQLKDNENVKYMWDFDDSKFAYEHNNIKLICSLLNHSNDILNIYKNKKNKKGCFGVMSIINWELVKKIDEKYCLFQTFLKKFNRRDHRCALERIYSLILYDIDYEPDSCFGDIHKYLSKYKLRWGYSYNSYNKNKNNLNLPIVKVYTGR